MSLNKDMMKFIKIDENSRVSKYQQIVNSIIHHISNGNLVMDQKIPSISSFSEEFYLSRDTVEKAYNILKERNIISSIKGRGYYIARTKLISKVNILFFMNKLSWYKMEIYHAFINNMGPNAHTDLHIYHCDESLFLNLLNKHKISYDYYVIMPHFKTEKFQHATTTVAVTQAINKIAKHKLVIMDNVQLPVENNVISVYQDFEKDIYNALNEGVEKLSKYKKIVLVYPEKTVYPYPRRILHGFRKFCVAHHFEFEFLDEVCEDMVIFKGDLFITIEEHDLVNLIKQVKERKYELGKDVGIISYNDTPLKELLGITVVSTDFKIMGETAAKMILNKKKGQVKVPFNFIDRESV